MKIKEEGSKKVVDNVYDLINTSESLDKLPWNDLFNEMYADWLDRHTECSPIIVLQRYLFKVQSYSKRLLCLSKLQEAAYTQIAEESYAQEWDEDFNSYIRYNERLRDLKDRGFEVAPRWGKNVSPMDEISLLMEYLSPEELVAYAAIAKQIYMYNQKNQSKNSLSSYSLIFRSSSLAKVGAMSVVDFCREFTCMEKYRSSYIARREESVQSIIPVSRKHREQCIEIYIRERIKHIKEELLAADDTRPTPDDKECMRRMHDQDEKMVQFFSDVQAEEPILDMLLLMATQTKEPDTGNITLGKEGWTHMIKMMQFYLQCLEKMMKEPTTSSHVAQGIQYNGPVYYGTVNNITNNYATSPEEETQTGQSSLRIKMLFVSKEGFENVECTKKEKERFMRYVSDHKLGKILIDSSQDNPILKAIVCFYAKWKSLKLTSAKCSPTAILRFLSDICGLKYDTIEVKSISNTIGRMVRNGYDKSIFYDVCDYF